MYFRPLEPEDAIRYLWSDSPGMPDGGVTRIAVTLEAGHAAKLERMAAQARTHEGALARSLLARAIDEVDLDGDTMTEILNGIPGALERARHGHQPGARGETIPLGEL